MSDRVTRSMAAKGKESKKVTTTKDDDEEEETEEKEDEEENEHQCEACSVRTGGKQHDADFSYLPSAQRPMHSHCRKCDRHYWYTQADAEIDHPHEVVGPDICYGCVSFRKAMQLFMGRSY
jgi:uncharacterized protein with PIN domain